MISFFKRREPRVSPEELDRQTAAINEKLEREGPKMRALASYLLERKDQNGLGEDFEVSLKPRGA